MKIDCNAPGGICADYGTVSEALSDNQIVRVTKQSDGRFMVVERCDEYFEAHLTKEQLLQWSEELRTLALHESHPA